VREGVKAVLEEVLEEEIADHLGSAIGSLRVPEISNAFERAGV
jgi:hypothetical protein